MADFRIKLPKTFFGYNASYSGKMVLATLNAMHIMAASGHLFGVRTQLDATYDTIDDLESPDAKKVLSSNEFDCLKKACLLAKEEGATFHEVVIAILSMCNDLEARDIEFLRESKFVANKAGDVISTPANGDVYAVLIHNPNRINDLLLSEKLEILCNVGVVFENLNYEVPKLPAVEIGMGLLLIASFLMLFRYPDAFSEFNIYWGAILGVIVNCIFRLYFFRKRNCLDYWFANAELVAIFACFFLVEVVSSGFFAAFIACTLFNASFLLGERYRKLLSMICIVIALVFVVIKLAF